MTLGYGRIGSGLAPSLVDEKGPPRPRPAGAAAVVGVELVGSDGAGSSFAVSTGWAVLGCAVAVFVFAPWRDAQETNAKPTTKAPRRESVFRMMLATRTDGRFVCNEIP